MYPFFNDPNKYMLRVVRFFIYANIKGENRLLTYVE